MITEKKQDSVAGLVEEIREVASEYAKQEFRKKEVSALPNLPFELELAEGWTSKLISADAVRDMWLKKAKPGTLLPEHFHPHQSQIATVISGACFIAIEGEGFDLGIGESLTIPQGKKHEMVADEEEGCELMVVYQPPLTAQERQT